VIGDQTVDGSETGTSFKQALYFKDCGFNLHDTMIYNKMSCRYPETNRYYPCFEYMFVLSKGPPKTYNLIADRPNKYKGSKVARKRAIRTIDGEMIENSANRVASNRVIKDVGVRFNIWDIPSSTCEHDKLSLQHPASFPLKLAVDHILSWSNEGDLVLDLMCGSGTTCLAALKLGRKYIGIDISEEYCELSRKRINDYLKQGKLF